MFGFVRIDKNELKIKDYEVYKAVYCGLCRKLKRTYGLFSGFLLNYDCAFYALFLMSVSETCPNFSNGRCAYNPLKSCKYCNSSNEALDKAAALVVLMSYYKILDNIHDSRLFKKFVCYIIKPFFNRWHRKASANFSEYDDLCRKLYEQQLKCEADNASVDESAEPTANLLKTLFSMDCADARLKPAYEQFGYHLGRWVYLIDAACDIDDDIKDKSFNPIYNKLGKPKADSMEYCDELLSQSVYLLTNAYRLIDIKRYNDILDNVILLGLTKKQKEVLFSGKE